MVEWHIAQINVAHAFAFKQKFPPPGSTGQPETLRPEPDCVGWE
jgi:hypothetical protein